MLLHAVANEAGTFRFSYVITDGMGHEATGHSGHDPAERRPDGPTATDDQVDTTVNTPIVINVLGNDSDPSGDPLQLDGQPNCQYGTCKVNSDQTITFTPPKDAFSTYRFTYRVRNSIGQTAEATVAVQVKEVPVVNQSRSPETTGPPSDGGRARPSMCSRTTRTRTRHRSRSGT